MTDPFQTSLLREKFIITEIGGVTDAAPVIALSNRMDIALANSKGTERENFVIRTQNMHSCVRFAAAITREHEERGAITYRVRDFDWQPVWMDIIKGYEKDWNPDIWCALYMNGRLLYSYGTHHNFLDIIEQCDAHHKSDYPESVKFAEKAFQQAGKMVRINHESNISLIVTTTPTEAKCGIALRGANKRNTFSFKAIPRVDGKKEPLRPPTVLSICAAYLEGVQLAFQVGMMNFKYKASMIEPHSDEYRQRERATSRLGNLNRAVLQFDKDFTVTYRPESPDFQAHVVDAESLAAKTFKNPAPETA